VQQVAAMPEPPDVQTWPGAQGQSMGHDWQFSFADG
jgi:hypothetical protein